MGQKITIDPITRLEGHGKISIFMDDAGEVERAILQVPELRGFEAFSVGRPAEEMPQITSRICGVCPTAHHMASTKALDALYDVHPTQAAKTIRELFYHLFMFEDHTLHFYFLGGPDFIVGPEAPAAKRNILGVTEKVGPDIVKRVIDIRKRARDIMTQIGGKPIHPVLGLPGGVAKTVSEDLRKETKAFAKEAIEFAQFTLGVFGDRVLGNPAYVDLIKSDEYCHETYYMGLVGEEGQLNFYEGQLKIVGPNGEKEALFDVRDYADIFAEHVEEWSYIKFPYLRNKGWQGFRDGPESGLVRVAPMARLNVASKISTPLAQKEYDRLLDTLGKKPIHNTLALHWARLVELLYTAEYVALLAERPELTSTDIRNMDLKTPKEGVGVVEAPRGTLIHHYETDERGVITGANLLVATLFNSGPMCMSIEKVARKLIKNGEPTEGMLNKVEMAFRAYDPCLSCATHSLPGKMPLIVDLRTSTGKLYKKVVRLEDGTQKVIAAEEAAE